MSLRISSFAEWYEEADIPEFDNGLKLWFDLETGLYYDPFGKLDGSKPSQSVTPRYVPSDNVKKARQFIKTIGGKALTGTPKQKEWAEKIRLDQMTKLDPEDAKQVVFHEIFAHSKFWIETRDKSAESILTFARKIISYTKIINELGNVLGIIAEYADVKFNRLIEDPKVINYSAKYREFLNPYSQVTENYDFSVELNIREIAELIKFIKTDIDEYYPKWLEAKYNRLLGNAIIDLRKKANAVVQINRNSNIPQNQIIETCRLYYLSKEKYDALIENGIESVKEMA